MNGNDVQFTPSTPQVYENPPSRRAFRLIALVVAALVVVGGVVFAFYWRTRGGPATPGPGVNTNVPVAVEKIGEPKPASDAQKLQGGLESGAQIQHVRRADGTEYDLFTYPPKKYTTSAPLPPPK